MIPVDPVLLSAFRQSHTKYCVLSVYEGTTQVAENVLISEGSVSADRYQKARRTLSCTIPLSQWQDVVGLNVISSRIQVWIGYDLGGSQVLVPLGVFRVDDLNRTDGGSLQVSGTSLEAYVIEDQFIDELVISVDEPIIAMIQELIIQSLPDASFVLDDWATSQLGARTQVALSAKRDRWDAVTQLAEHIDCDVFCGPDGKFRISRRPKMVDSLASWNLNEGPDGVLVSMNNRVSRDNTYNAVLVLGQNSDSSVPPFSAVAYDDAANSPTRWGGPFGRKLYVFQDDMMSSQEQCLLKAQELLEFFRAEDRELDLTAIPNPAIEPDDIVEVQMLDGTVERHLITAITIPIGLGTWSATTLSNKKTIEEG